MKKNPGPAKVPPNKAFAADGQDSPFFEVDFGTLSQLFSEGSMAAAEMQALAGRETHLW